MRAMTWENCTRKPLKAYQSLSQIDSRSSPENIPKLVLIMSNKGIVELSHNCPRMVRDVLI